MHDRCGFWLEASQRLLCCLLKHRHPLHHLKRYPKLSHCRVLAIDFYEISDFIAVEPRFEVIGNVCSLLNVSIPASWPLYTRRGTLVSVRGQIENVPPPMTTH